MHGRRRMNSMVVLALCGLASACAPVERHDPEWKPLQQHQATGAAAPSTVHPIGCDARDLINFSCGE